MFSIKAHDRDQRAHRLIDQVNLLERRLADAIKLGNTTQAVKLQRRIKVIDRQAWDMSSDDSNQCDNCGSARSALNRVGLCAMCASTVEEQHG
jgi:ribosomal protein S14